MDRFVIYEWRVQEKLKKQVRSPKKIDREIANKQINSKLLNTNHTFLFIFDGFEKTNAIIGEFELLEMIIRNLPKNINMLITSRLSKSTFLENNIETVEKLVKSDFLKINMFHIIFKNICDNREEFNKVLYLISLFEDKEINMDLFSEVFEFDQKYLRSVFTNMEKNRLMISKQTAISDQILVYRLN